jgi:hypothetical protein
LILLLRLLQHGGSFFSIYFPQEQGSPVIPPGIGFVYYIYILWHDVCKFNRQAQCPLVRLQHEPHRKRSSSYLHDMATARATPFLSCVERPLPSNVYCLQSHCCCTVSCLRSCRCLVLDICVTIISYVVILHSYATNHLCCFIYS